MSVRAEVSVLAGADIAGGRTMKDSQCMVLRKENLEGFIARLATLQTVAAPVARGYGSFSFAPVTSAAQITLEHIPTILPPKKYFMPPQETLLEYEMKKGVDVTTVVDCEEMVIFGVHTCDLAGIQCLNMVFSDRPRDMNYLTRKRGISIVGLECGRYCDEFASCHLVNASLPNGGYDLFFTDLGETFLVHVNTQRGDELVELTKAFEPAGKSDLDSLAAYRERKREVFAHEVPVEPRHLPEVFDREFESRIWKDLEERCLACGNCTMVCPTCFCFDIREEVDLPLRFGRRYRTWDSCQLEPFAKVAGGENFRKSRSARQRHRYYRKFRYPVEKFHRFFCTGCGRCSRSCMADIRLLETLNALIKESEAKRWKGWL
jgi:sulfhydrogenase subunit beta (sulfur reductase)